MTRGRCWRGVVPSIDGMEGTCMEAVYEHQARMYEVGDYE